MNLVSVLWKTPVIAGVVILGVGAASQFGWSVAEFLLNWELMGLAEQVITTCFYALGGGVAVVTVWAVYRLAKPVLWIQVPCMAYSAIVLGAWNGFASDFDSTRGQAIKYGIANVYALQHMTERGLYSSCHDERIELDKDGTAYCERVLGVAPGERIPGSEHKCGFLNMFVCFYTGAERAIGPGRGAKE